MNEKPYVHPVFNCNDGIISSYTRLKIDLKNPKPDMFTLEDIAKGLANTCRFGGQMREFYSVAQHSVLVVMLAPAELAAAALLHDASEAYLGDVVKPLKNMISGYAEIEEAFERVIFKKFKVDFDLLKAIKPYDLQALQIEYEFLHGQSSSFGYFFRELGKDIYWTPEEAFQIYKRRLELCFKD